MDYLERAIEIAIESAQTGGGPFGAVIVTEDGQVFEGTNGVTRTCDPTAHAEVTAIRAAGAALGTHVLDGATLYSSCQPCPMCLTAALWARIPRIVYAADKHDAAAGGFDDSKFYAEVRRDMSEVESAHISAELLPNRTTPFEAFLANEDHIPY